MASKLRHTHIALLYFLTQAAGRRSFSRTLSLYVSQFLTLCYNFAEVLHRHLSWESPVSLNADSREEARWWIDHLVEWNGRAIQVPTPELIVRSDAASHGGGGWGWLRSGVRPATGRWPLVSSRTEVAYQRPGTIDRQPGGADVCEKLPQQPCLDADGQPGGSELREQDGRSPQCSSVSACAGSLDMVPGSQHHSLCRVPAGEPGRRSGFLVTESQFSGVGAAPSGIRSDPVSLSPQ